MSHNSGAGLVRLFYDGRNVATYNVRDAIGFDFASDTEVTVGWQDTADEPRPEVLPAITDGAENLQALVDAFNALGLPAVEPEELVDLVVGTERLFVRKRDALDPVDDAELLHALASADLGPVKQLAGLLMRNPYTVHQVPDYMKVAPLRHLYQIADGQVVVQREAALVYTSRERLDPPDFDLNDISVWDRTLTAQEVRGALCPTFSADDAGAWRVSLHTDGLHMEHPPRRHSRNRQGRRGGIHAERSST